jgi:hypothetical protein
VHCRSGSDAAIGPDPTTMPFDDAATDKQAEADTCDVIRQAI